MMCTSQFRPQLFISKHMLCQKVLETVLYFKTIKKTTSNKSQINQCKVTQAGRDLIQPKCYSCWNLCLPSSLEPLHEVIQILRPFLPLCGRLILVFFRLEAVYELQLLLLNVRLSLPLLILDPAFLHDSLLSILLEILLANHVLLLEPLMVHLDLLGLFLLLNSPILCLIFLGSFIRGGQPEHIL